MSRKNASADRGGGMPAGAAPGERAGAGGTSTDQLPAQTFAQHNANGHTTLETFPHNAGKVTRKPKDTRTNISPRTATPQEAAILSLTASNVSKPATTTPAEALSTPERQEAFAQAIADHEGIIGAAEAWGLKATSVFYWARTRPAFHEMIYAAQAAVFQSQVMKLDNMCNKLLGMPPKEMNQCANAYGRVFDYRMRIVGKLLPVIYGDRPGTQVNIQNNTGIVCDEETRARLISLNQKLLTAGSTTTNQEQ